MRPARVLRLAAALLTTCLVLAGCASGDPADDASPVASASSANATPEAEGAFPVTIEHAFGETEISAQPERVVTWGWGSTEAAIALGTTPVAIAEQVWTVGEGNYLPWVEEALEDAGEPLPTLLTDDGTAPPYEEIIAQEPDLILAPYSGIDEQAYTLLSEIAPTVAYPEAAWATPWKDVIEITARALGRPEAGQETLDEIDRFMQAQAADHPEFEGVSVAAVWDGDGMLSIYTSLDARVAMLTELGFVVADSVDALDTDGAESNFYYELSYEEIDKLDADLLIAYHSTQDDAAAFLSKPQLEAIPAFAEGRVAQVVGNEYVSSVSPPTALSVEWGLPDMIEAMSQALTG